jgi:hypothetical protein
LINIVLTFSLIIMEEHFAYKHIIENKSFLHKELLFKLNEDLEVVESVVLEVIKEENLEEDLEVKEVLEEKNEIIQEEVKEEDLEVKEVLEEKNEIIQEEVKEENLEEVESVVLEEKNEIIQEEVKEVLEEKNEVIEEYIWCLHIECLCKLDYFSNIDELEKHMLEDH